MNKKIILLLLVLSSGLAKATTYTQTWSNLTSVTNASGVLTKTTAAGWNNAGARARNTLMANVDGWMEFTIDQNATTANYMVGFSAINNVYIQSAIDFGVEVSSQNGVVNLLAHEGSVTGTNLGTVVIGDVIRVSREGSLIKYYINGAEKRSVTGSASAYYITKVLINTGKTAPIVTSYDVLNETGEIPNALEQAALKDMYDNLGGSAWTNSPYWPTTGTLPVNKTASNGVWIVNGDVTRIYMQSCNVTGTIPASIGNLSKLQYIFFQTNKLSGSLPSSIGNLAELGYLYLEYNQLSGAVPATLGNATSLALLHLSANKITSVPAELNKLSKLTDLSFSTNLITSLPDYSALSKVTYLNIAANPYTAGSFPAWVLNMPQLTNLYLNSSNLTGSIPDGIGTSLPLLMNLDLSSNPLSGSIPSSIGNLTKLQYLKIVGSQLTGSIPDVFGNMKDLLSLNLSINQLSGSIPSSIGSCTKLITLDLSANKLTGSIPASIGSTNLTNLFLYTNQLNGEIPTELGKLINLTNFQLQTNQLTGSIPSSLGDLINLQYFWLSSNKLTGSIPSSLGKLTKVLQFYLSANQLTGTIPSTLGNLNLVQQFCLNDNKLSGAVPSSLSGLSSAWLFYLYNNQLSGDFPDIFSGLKKLNVLYAYNNQFTGAIPSSIGNCTTLTAISFYTNRITSLPASMLTLPVLSLITFYDNEIVSIPDFSTAVNKANLTLNIYSNRLDFSQLEKVVGAGIKTVSYSPQKNIQDTPMVNLTVGSPLVIPARDPGAFSTITWERLNGTTWTSVNSSDQDATLKTYTRTVATTADEGTYRWKMTNSKITSVTSQSDPISVKGASRFALDTWGFQYKYDARRRMIAKKVPGADWVYMVYDVRDRLVLTQDGNQRGGTTQYWTFTKYDELNRPIMTGIKDTTAGVTQADMQSAVDTYYRMITDPINPKAYRKYGETYKGTSVTNTVHGYSNYSYPRVTTGTTLDIYKYLTVIYYDNYTFRNDWPGSYAYSTDGLTSTSLTGPYTQPATENKSVIGLVTGAKTKVLDGGVAGGYTWLKTISYYDNKYRVIQTQADNYKGGKDQVSNLYDFVGKVLTTKETHIEYDPTITSAGNINQVGNKLVSMNSSGTWGNAGAASIQTLAANQNGWVECTASETTTERIFGLSDSNPDYGYASIRYGFQQSPLGLYAIEGGAQTQLSTTYNPGEILTIERVGSTINYKRNGATIRTVTNALTTPLFIDIAMNHLSGTLVGLRSSFSTTSHSITRRFIYDHASRLLEMWHQIDAQRADAQPDVRIAYNEYNELGQLIDKKLHSKSAYASDNKQSVDYRYNIRGWLTSMNNSQLADDHTTTNTNDDTSDLFGMNLLYENNNASLGSTGLFNGNISGMKWSVGTGKADTKELGYNFSYDAMNRLKDANSRVNNTSGWGAGNYDEKGLSYDLNGNIKTLQRRGDGGAQIDNLVYNYGTNGNQLQYVQDITSNVADKIKGFADGNINQNTDYTYDVNGNMTHDLNKEIGASITDNTSIITYNYLNLPEKIVKKNTTDIVQYVYDATGRKLSQSVSGATFSFKNTDYAGEFTYEQDVLKYISHEEGRIVVQKQDLIYLNDGSTLAGTTASTSTTGAISSLATINGQTYISVAYTGTTQRSGITNLGNGPITVQTGDRYLLRVKGYRNGNTPVVFSVRVNGSIDLGTSASLPFGATEEGWIEKTITIPTGGSALSVGLIWIPVATGESFAINDIEISKLSTTTPEYQYNLKDHLGNVRVTFTSTPETVSDIATLESSNLNNETSKFLRRDRVRVVNNALFDHTNDATGASGGAIRLSGSANEKTGLVKSIAVMPGDVVNMEVWAKYIDNNANNWTGDLTPALMNAIVAGTGGTVTDGGSYSNNSSNSFPFTGLDGTGNSTGLGPKAYLNYIMFDKDFNPIITDPSQTNYVRLSDRPKENGQNINHEKMIASVTVKQAGYMYIYLSNEEETPVEVYFDDFKVTQVKSPVIASNDYYPFGLTFNSYSRENSTPNNYLYNGKELQDELNLGWYDYQARQYDPAIARWMAVDPLADLSRRWSPYTYCYNNPLIFIDPDGMFGDYYNENGEHLGSDGIDDNKVYQTTDKAYSENVDEKSFASSNGEGPDYEGLKSSTDTHYLGETNEFGLIQLTGMGNEHIENYGSEDTYSYSDSEGKTVAAGQHGDDWVTPGVGAAFNAAVNKFVAQEGNENVVVKVNDASAFNPAKDLGHKTHFSGKSIDMPFIKADGSNSNSISSLTQADKTKTGDFTKILSDKGFSKNYSDNGAIPNTSHAAGHKDHLHVGKP